MIQLLIQDGRYLFLQPGIDGDRLEGKQNDSHQNYLSI